jgi:predicted P-loop ATPase
MTVKKLLTISDLPDIKRTANGQAFRQVQPFTAPNLARVLAHMDVRCAFDMQRSAMALYVGDERVTEQAEGRLVQSIRDALVRLDINATVSAVTEALLEMAREHPFHPMEDYLNSLTWDGEDHMAALAASVDTPTALWPVYLRKWMIQVVEAVCGWREATEGASLPYVLVLAGGQGLGKTHLLAQLGLGRWMKSEAELHLSSASGKDHQLEALKYPMVELSELDGIFRKSDISHMKAFISRPQDTIRAPYERRAVSRPRMTVFCGSVNDAEFLNDPTGSRRFWPVAVEAIDWNVEVDIAQLWAQAFELWLSGAPYCLSAEEEKARAGEALDMHTALSPIEETLREYYRLHNGNKRFESVPMNRSEIMNMVFGKQNHWHRDISVAGRIITDMCGKHRTLDGKQRAWMFPFNEFATDRATWPDNISLKSV